MFLCPGRVRWMNNNKGIIARLLITSGWVTLRPRGAGVNLCLEGHMAPGHSLVIWNTGNTGCGQHTDSDE